MDKAADLDPDKIDQLKQTNQTQTKPDVNHEQRITTVVNDAEQHCTVLLIARTDLFYHPDSIEPCRYSN